MNIGQRLEVRQSQTLVMTPQLRQAIKLLQMSNQEASEYVAEEIEKNPLLERADEADLPIVESMGMKVYVDSENELVPAPIANRAISALDEVVAVAIAPEAETRDGSVGWDNSRLTGAAAGTGENAFMHSGSFENDDEFSAVRGVAATESLRDHLLVQIHTDFSDPAERMIAAALMELLDESGYLPEDLRLAQAQLGATPEQLEKVISKLQRLDPPGIFARSLQECLAIQLGEKNRLDPAMQTLLQHLDLVAKRENKALMKLCGVDAEDLAGMLNEIRVLNPKPAAAFTSDIAPPVTPDVLLYPQPGGGWQIELNSNNLPRVLANEHYYAEVRSSARTREEKEYLGERWRQANWLVKALHQRAVTILRVAAEIVRRQDKFFLYGVQCLSPLVLRDIAEAVEMHESTVSRVTQNKYIATPRGMFELKYFFSGAIATIGGDNISSLAVKDRIRALIDNEAPNDILSDDQIVTLLRKEGIDIARRTVAKYREAMRIPSSAQRRREKKKEK